MSQIVKYRQFRGMIKKRYLGEKKGKADSLGTGQPFSMTVELTNGGSITFLTELSMRKNFLLRLWNFLSDREQVQDPRTANNLVTKSVT